MIYFGRADAGSGNLTRQRRLSSGKSDLMLMETKTFHSTYGMMTLTLR